MLNVSENILALLFELRLHIKGFILTLSLLAVTFIRLDPDQDQQNVDPYDMIAHS